MRKVKSCNAELVQIPPMAISDFNAWAVDQCREQGYEWLLVHSLEGVYWGRFTNGALMLALPPDVARSAAGGETSSFLRAENILQLRLFSATQELFLWQCQGDKLRGRAIKDVEPPGDERWRLCMDETHLLWGNAHEPIDSNCTRLIERGRGFQQIIPIAFSAPAPDASSDGGSRRARLEVRHYLDEMPDSGQVVISCGRLKGLVVG